VEVNFKEYQDKIILYDTMQKKKVKFIPLQKGKIGMYVCGPTVYDDPHLGHARAAIAFDVIYRFFQFIGFEVTYVRNYTDVDDKIINRAREEGIDPSEVAEKYIRSYEEDMNILRVKEPTHKPRVTQHITQIIQMIEKILENGHGYVVDGNVYFDVLSFPSYGKLSGRNIDELQSGARVEVDPNKKHPLDFALWKAAKEGEPWWDSPWGRGRPGWHIECSAMSTHYLGIPFDIHGGGIDLVFPHHENEIAQSEAAYKKKFVNYWLHNGHVEINREKMSKSLKNFIRVKDAVKNFEPEAIRFFLLQTHYRSPINFTPDVVRSIENNLISFYQTLEAYEKIKDLAQNGEEREFLNNLSKKQKQLFEIIDDYQKTFLDALSDNFNTAKATATLFQFFSDLNKLLRIHTIFQIKGSVYLVKKLDSFLQMVREVFGILEENPSDFIERVNMRRLKEKGIDKEFVEEQVKKRSEARKQRNWEEADKIRDDLKKMGIILEDTPEGTKWRVE